MKAPPASALCVMALALVVAGALRACPRRPAPPPPEPVPVPAADAGAALPPPPCVAEDCEDRPEALQCADTRSGHVPNGGDVVTCMRWVVEYRRHCECYQWGARP